MGSGMAIRIGFVVLDGREHSKRRKLSIPSRIRGPVAIIILSRKRFRRNHPSILSKPQTPVPKMTARTVRIYQVFIVTKSGFVKVFASQTNVFSWTTTFLVLCIINSLQHVFMSHGWAGHVQRLVLYRAASTGQVQRMALYLAASTSQVQRMALYCVAVRIDFPEKSKRYLEY